MFDSSPPTGDMAPLRPVRRSRWRGWWTLFLVALILFLLRGPILRAVGNWLVVDEEPVKSELVVALGGQSGYRVHKAAELVRAGYAPRVALTGPEPAFPELEEPSYVRWLSVLERVGIPPDSVALLVPSASTFTDAIRIREYVEREGTRRVLVVTDPYHTRRARWILRRVLADTDVEFRMVASDVPNTDPDRWWQDERQFLWVHSEYLKFAYYLRHYGGRGPIEAPAAAHTEAERGARKTPNQMP